MGLMAAPASLFEPVDDGLWLPTDVARGPWSPDALHGGPTAALLTRAVESAPSDGPMQVARITVELMRPVPVTPLRVEVSVVRPGRKVQLVEALLWAAEVQVARAVALRIRVGAVDIPDLPASAAGDPPPARSAGRTRPRREGEWTAFHNSGVEMRYTAGFMDEPGGAVVWMRLVQPVVPDEEPSPAQRVAAVADFGNGVSSVVDWNRYLFINPDLTVYFVRPAAGEWICLDARTVIASGEFGMGLAESALYDETGRIGRSLQSLLVDARP
jgi:hypothetical protein